MCSMKAPCRATADQRHSAVSDRLDAPRTPMVTCSGRVELPAATGIVISNKVWVLEVRVVGKEKDCNCGYVYHGADSELA